MENNQNILSSSTVQLLQQQAGNSLNDYNKNFKPETVEEILKEATLHQADPWSKQHSLFKLISFLSYELGTLQAIQRSLMDFLDKERKERRDLKQDKQRLRRFDLKDLDSAIAKRLRELA